MPTKYRDIINKLEQELRHMRSDGRSKLPTEAQLCSEFNCSRQTVRSALADLEQRGLIVRKRGSGSYLADGASAYGDTVVFICEDEDEYTYPALISLLRTQLKPHKLKLVCSSTHTSLESEHQILTDLITTPPAAVIIEPYCNIIPNPNIKLISQLAGRGVAVVYLFTAYESGEGHQALIAEDNYGGASMLVRHLASSGHTRIAGIWRCDDSRGLERYDGYINTLSELGLPIDVPNLMLTGADRRSLLKRDDSILKAFVSGLNGCTAIICHNDEIAYRLARLTAPGIAIVSFDDSYYAASDKGAITSLAHDGRLFVDNVVKAVVAGIEHKKYKGEPAGWKLKVRKSG